MIPKLAEWLNNKSPATTSGKDETRLLQLTSATLMTEVMAADFDEDETERETIRRLLHQQFDLSTTELDTLMTEARHNAKQATSLYPLVKTLIEKLSIEQRADVIEQMWRVAYADGRIDKYEEACVRKVSDLLFVPDSLFVRSKLRASGEL